MRAVPLLSIVLVANVAVAAEAPANAVQVLLAGGVASPAVRYERAVAEHVGVSAVVTFTQQTPIGDGTALANLNLSVAPGASYFLTGQALDGVWVGARASVSLGQLGLRTNGADQTPTRTWTVGGDVLFGMDALVGPNVSLHASVGVGVARTWVNVGGVGGSGLGGLGTATPGFSSGLRTNLGLGWAF